MTDEDNVCPECDDILMQEIESLKDQLKTATRLLIEYGYEVTENSFLHTVGHVDYQTWVEEVLSPSQKEENKE